MAAPSQINTLRAEDFPDGIASKGTADKLFRILNPFLQNLQQTTTAGTSLQSNIDGQFAQADIAKGSALKIMTLTSPFTGNAFTGWTQPSYRVDGTGRLWMRGLLTWPTVPTAGQGIWTYPDPLLAPTNSTTAAGRLFTLDIVTGSGEGEFQMRADAYVDKFVFTGNVMGGTGTGTWNTLSLAANWSAPSGPTPGYLVAGDGRVYLRGFLRKTGVNMASGDTIATLPAGARPSVQMDYGGTLNGDVTSNMACSIRIGTDGTIKAFFVAAAQTINAFPIGHISFDLTLTAIPPVGLYTSLDAISWDTQGGPSLATRPGFPLNIRLKDGKKPVAVLCWAVNKNTNAVEICTEPGWIAQGTGPTGNQLTITSVANLRDDQPYTLNFFIFF